MQVLVKSTKEDAATHCGVCGQGFVLYGARQEKMELDAILKEVALALESHHANGTGSLAHPDKGFLVPAWDGPVAYSGAAILGNAPNWAL
jgi:hypothetical protein